MVLTSCSAGVSAYSYCGPDLMPCWGLRLLLQTGRSPCSLSGPGWGLLGRSATTITTSCPAHIRRTRRTRNQQDQRPGGPETRRTRDQEDQRPAGPETRRTRDQEDQRPGGPGNSAAVALLSSPSESWLQFLIEMIGTLRNETPIVTDFHHDFSQLIFLLSTGD